MPVRTSESRDDSKTHSLPPADRRTLDALFRHPLKHNLAWADIVSLIGRIGSVEQRPSNDYAFLIDGHSWNMHKRHAKDLGSEEVMGLRHFLSRAGWAPAMAVARTVVPAGSDLLVAIDHREAKIYRIDPAGRDISETPIQPYDPHGYLHHLTHKDEDREQGQRAPEDATFYDRIAALLTTGGCIVIAGHGAGHSNAAAHLSAYLKTHHPATARRITAELIVDLSSITPPQLLDQARQALQGRIH